MVFGENCGLLLLLRLLRVFALPRRRCISCTGGFSACLRLLRCGASKKSIGAEKLLGHVVKPWGSVLALQIVAGIMWSLGYKHRYRTFGEYFNSLLKQYLELPCAEDQSPLQSINTYRSWIGHGGWNKPISKV